MNVLFVCTGNTCRSPMAEHLFRKMLADAGRNGVRVSSAGVAPAHWLELPAEAREALKNQGVTSVHHRPRGVDDAAMKGADLVLVMEARHRDLLVERFPEAASKVHLLREFAGLDSKGVRDPFGESPASYASALKQIKEALARLVDKVRAE